MWEEPEPENSGGITRVWVIVQQLPVIAVMGRHCCASKCRGVSRETGQNNILIGPGHGVFTLIQDFAFLRLSSPLERRQQKLP